MTKFWEAPDGLSLDVAPFVAALEHAARRKAMIFGKLALAFFETASCPITFNTRRSAESRERGLGRN
jgi:hypothetical protein